MMKFKDPRMGWWRDIAFYGIIPAMVAWQGFKYGFDKEAILTSVLTGLIGMKAKMSNGHPKPDDDGKE